MGTLDSERMPCGEFVAREPGMDIWSHHHHYYYYYYYYYYYFYYYYYCCCCCYRRRHHHHRHHFIIISLSLSLLLLLLLNIILLLQNVTRRSPIEDKHRFTVSSASQKCQWSGLQCKTIRPASETSRFLASRTDGTISWTNDQNNRDAWFKFYCFDPNNCT